MDQFNNPLVTSESYYLSDLSRQVGVSMQNTDSCGVSQPSFQHSTSTSFNSTIDNISSQATDHSNFAFDYAPVDTSRLIISGLDTSSYFPLNELPSSSLSDVSSLIPSFEPNIDYSPIDSSKVVVSCLDTSTYYSFNESSSSLSSNINSVVVPFDSATSQQITSTPILSSTQTFSSPNESPISPCNSSPILADNTSLFYSNFESIIPTQTTNILSQKGADDAVFKYVCDNEKHGNMFELVGFDSGIRKWTVRCVGCESEFSKPTTNSLKGHLSKPTHTQLSEIEAVGELTKAETFARMKAITDDRFSNFIDSVENFCCKYCDCILYTDSESLQAHKSKRDHINHMPSEMQVQIHVTKLNDPSRIAKIDDIVELFEGLIGKATKEDVDFCKSIEIYRETPSLRLNAVYCTICRREFDRCDPNRYVEAILEHLDSKVHSEAVKEKQRKEEQEIEDIVKGITRDSIPKTPTKKIAPRTHFVEDLKYTTSICLLENRPFSRVNDSDYRSTRRLVGRDISKTTMLDRGLDAVHKDYIKYMKRDLVDRDIFIMLDESVKGAGPKLLITIGSMDEEMIRHEFLAKELDGSPTNVTIYNAIIEALVKLWGSIEEVKRRQAQVLIIVSDGASYMLTAGRKLKNDILYEMIHITCVTHGLSLVCQEIAKQHPRVVKFMSLMKRVMCNSTARREAYKNATNSEVCTSLIEDLFEADKKETTNLANVSLQEILSNATDETWEYLLTESGASSIWARVWDSVVQKADSQCVIPVSDDSTDDRVLPPHPVNTRFGTFMVAVCYYHHCSLKSFNFGSTIVDAGGTKKETKTITQLKQMLLQSDELTEEIEHLFNHLKLIPMFIASTEAEYLKATESEKILQRAHSYLKSAAINEANCVNATKYFSARKALSKFEATMDKNSGLRLLFKLAKTNKIYDYSPTSSCRIERKFSLLDFVLGKRRHFKSDNFTKFTESTFYLKNEDAQRNKLNQKPKKTNKNFYLESNVERKKRALEIKEKKSKENPTKKRKSISKSLMDQFV